MFEAESLTPSFAEVQNVWYYNFTPTIRLRGVHRDFTLPLFGPALSTGYEGDNVLTAGEDIIKFYDEGSQNLLASQYQVKFKNANMSPLFF